MFLLKFSQLATLPLLFLALLAGTGEVYAGVTVDKNVVDITTGQSRRADILITNTGATTSSVSITASRIDNPGLSNERRWNPDNPREIGMIASPRELSLKPGESRKVRFSFLNPARETDRIFRVRVTPQSPDTTEVGESAEASRKIRLTIAFDLLVILRPPEPELLYDVQREGNFLTITNQGNSNFLLFSGQQCEDLEQETGCQLMPAKRIYAGATHRFTLPMPDKPVTFLLNQSGNTQRVYF